MPPIDSISRISHFLLFCSQTIEGPSITLPQGQLRKMLQDLGLMEQALLFMILGIAEKLAPGTYIRTLGDPLSMEDKFREMIDSF